MTLSYPAMPMNFSLKVKIHVKKKILDNNMKLKLIFLS